MKTVKFTLSFLAILIAGITAHSQSPVVVNGEMVSMSKGEQPAFIVMIPQTAPDVVKKAWEKYIRQNTKSKVEEKNNEIIILNTQIDVISENPVNIYSAVFQVDSSVKLISLFEIDSSFFSFDGDSKDINYERTYQGIRFFLHDFAVNEYKKAVEQELKNRDKELKSLNKEHENIVKQIESFHKKIKHNESDSINAEIKIKSLETDKVRKQEEIDGKKQSMSSLSGNKELTDEVKKLLKVLEKERKKIEKEIQKLKDNIVEYQLDNREFERKIEEKNIQKEEALTKINEQKEVIKKVTEKLTNIK